MSAALASLSGGSFLLTVAWPGVSPTMQEQRDVRDSPNIKEEWGGELGNGEMHM